MPISYTNRKELTYTLYRGQTKRRVSTAGWNWGKTESVAKLARALIPILGTEQFYELW